MMKRRIKPANSLGGVVQLGLIAAQMLFFSSVLAVDADFNQDETGDTYQAPPRVLVDPFLITLVGTARALTVTEQDDLLDILQETVYDYAVQQQTADGGPTLRWIGFNDVTQEHNQALQSLDFTVGAGIFSYSDYPVPSQATVDGLVREALEMNLMSELQQHPTFSVLSNAYFEFLVEPSVDEGIDDGDGDGGSEGDGGGSGGGGGTVTPIYDRAIEDGSSGSSDNMIPIIAGSVAGAVVVSLVVIALLAFRRRRKGQVEIEDLDRLDVDKEVGADGMAGRGVYTNDQGGPPNRADDGRSRADSESDWTVATEAGDSTALKSLHNNKSLANPQTIGTGTIPMSFAESFERDRQIAISKDMLTGLWSGAVSPGQRNGRNDNTQSESVLQPSHFSASQERRVRRAAASSSSPELDSSSISSDDEGENGSESDSVVFEQADAWADQPPSPSRASQSRSSPRRRGFL